MRSVINKLLRRSRRVTLSSCESLEPRQLLTVPDPVATVPVHVEQFDLFTDENLTTPGLVGSFVDRSLREEAAQVDWRDVHNIVGTRVDQSIEFWTNGWGDLSEVGLTNGTDDNWEDFSIQWDGFVQISQDDTQLWMGSDDGGRFWIDLNNNGEFESTELIDNNWGTAQAKRIHAQAEPIDVGTYAIRVQYEEGVGENALRLGSGPTHEYRIAYLIPQDRTPRQDVYDNLKFALPEYNNWLAEEFQRHGLETHQFAYEQDTDGTPKVHVLQLSEDAAFYHGDRGEIYNSVRESAYEAGVSRWEAGENWILIHEAAELKEDGSLAGQITIAASGGNGSGPGVVVGDSVAIGLADLETMQNDRAYDGEIYPEIGPFALVEGTTFHTDEGSSYSTLASSWFGRLFRQMATSIGITNNFRNDGIRNGNLLGKGHKGFRNWYFPDLYPNDEVWLSQSTAIDLSNSRFLNPVDVSTDELAPLIENAEIVGVENGHLIVSVTASDNVGLLSAGLTQTRNSHTVAWTELEGTTATFELAASNILNQEDQTFFVFVNDVSGRRARLDLEFPATEISNIAAIPKVKLSEQAVKVGNSVTIDASASFDRDGANSALRYEWDIDGDGTFDTTPSLQKMHTFTPTSAGSRYVSVRVTDDDGDQSVSQPLALMVEPVDLPGNIDGDGDFDASDAFLMQLVMLSGTDTQIDQSKGASSLTAAQIRTAINTLDSTGDVDGDNDFDANDTFLIQLVQLAGTDQQIDQSKGSSSLTASQIRSSVDALGNGGTPASQSFDNPSVQATKRTSLPTDEASRLHAVDVAARDEDAQSHRTDDPEFRTWISLF